MFKQKNNAVLVAALNQFASGCAANATALDLTAPQVEAINDAASSYETAFTNSETARLAAKSAVITKDGVRIESSDLATFWADQFYARGVDKSIMDELGLPARNSPGPRTAPTVPTEFSATPTATGEVNFRWKRNGNTNSTVFTVESSTGGAWSPVASTSKVRLTLTGYTPGAPVNFRVRAYRNNVTTAPSNESGIYGGGSGETLLKVA